MSEGQRIGRFVKAARSLLLLQLFAAALATALAIWAVTAVWELAAERDRLRAQVDAQQSAPAAAQQPATADEAILNEVRPPALLPIAIPISEPAADVNMMLPEPGLVPPGTNQAAEPPVDTPTTDQECTGADANQPRCRPGRWNRPVPQRPVPRPQPEPEQPAKPDAEPRPN